MKVIIVDSSTSLVDGELRSELLDWAGALGIDTGRATPTFVLAPSADGRMFAHFSLKRRRDGRDYLLPDANRVAIDFGAAVVEVAGASWPRWFGQPVEAPDMPIATLLETLAVADEACGNLASTVRHYLDTPKAVSA